MVRLRPTAPRPAVSARPIAARTTRTSSTRTSILDEDDMELPAVGAVNSMMLRGIERWLRAQRGVEARHGRGAVAAPLRDAAEVVVAQEDVCCLCVRDA